MLVNHPLTLTAGLIAGGRRFRSRRGFEGDRVTAAIRSPYACLPCKSRNDVTRVRGTLGTCSHPLLSAVFPNKIPNALTKLPRIPEYHGYRYFWQRFVIKLEANDDPLQAKHRVLSAPFPLRCPVCFPISVSTAFIFLPLFPFHGLFILFESRSAILLPDSPVPRSPVERGNSLKPRRRVDASTRPRIGRWPNRGLIGNRATCSR